MTKRYKYLKKWRAKNPEKNKALQANYRARNPDKVKDRKLKHNYGLSLEEFNAMSLAQGGLCLICGRPDRLCVDHCHTSGKVRGLLCSGCNGALGWFEAHGQKAVEYLRESRER